MKKIVVMGSTGSIGTQTLDIVREHRDELKVTALSASTSVDLIEKQAREFEPRLVAMYDPASAKDLSDRLKDTDIRVVSGMKIHDR